MSTFDQSLVEKYLKNECSVEEAKMVVTWFKTREGQEYLKSNLDKHLELADEVDYFMLDHKIQSEKIFQRISSIKNKKNNGSGTLTSMNWLRAAGNVAAIVFLFAAYVFLFSPDTQKLIEIDTPYGATKTVELPDGSMVTLNANSGLTYPASWQGQGDREVWLRGEAFFSVTHTVNDQRFIVHANQIDVEVLGTEFNVKNRRSKTQIVLASGKVKLTAKTGEKDRRLPDQPHNDISDPDGRSEKTIIMQPGEMVEFSEETKGFETKLVSPEKYSSWVENEWVFDQSSLKEALQVLEDFYGYKIQLTDPAMEDSIFTAKISSHEVDVLLEIIAESFELKVNKQQNVITLTK